MLVTFLFSLAIISQDPVQTLAVATSQVTAAQTEEPRTGERPAADRLSGGAREQQVVCRRERETGSNRPRNVCTRVGVDNYNREAARRWRENVVDSRGTPECATNVSAYCPAPRN
jgi:hypothetical protein